MNTDERKEMTYLKWVVGAVVVLGCAGWLAMGWALRDPHPAARNGKGVLAIRHARVYVSPDAPGPLEDVTVVVRDGVITEVGAGAFVPPEAKVIRCNGCTVTAGFWNAHVHFTEPHWAGAAWRTAPELQEHLTEMLNRRGFTTVVDTGSNPMDTIALRRRIEAGELRGPVIYTAGTALYPPRGIPYYLRETTPALIQWLMPQPATAAEAERVVERNIARGADLLKLFTGSWVERGKVLPMPVDVAKAAAAAAHRHGQLVYSHASNLAGTQVALESGVDVLAHAPDSPEGIDDALLGKMAARRMAMAPTLKMFGATVTKKSAYLEPIYQEVRRFHELGGELLFGTDVGYMTDYSTEDEYWGLTRCGLGWRDILRMLTTAPAARFGAAGERGTVAAGKVADLVVLDGDPAADVAAFARVRCTVRRGMVVWGGLR